MDDFELFDCDCLDDFEIRYATHVGLVPIGLFVGVAVSKSSGFGEIVGSDANVGNVGAGVGGVDVGVLPPWLGVGGWEFGISLTGASVGGARSSGGIVGLPNALLQNAGQALETLLTVTQPTLSPNNFDYLLNL